MWGVECTSILLSSLGDLLDEQPVEAFANNGAQIHEEVLLKIPAEENNGHHVRACVRACVCHEGWGVNCLISLMVDEGGRAVRT